MNTQPHIYLDYSASTPVDAEVAAIIQQQMDRNFGNASSIHSFGRQAKVVLEESRETIARFIGAETSEIFFTSGGTEADNHALIGTALAARRKTGRNHLIVSSIEHHAVLDCAEYLSTRGFRVTYIPVDNKGFVDPSVVADLITDTTSIISVMHANNETGALQPVRELSRLANEKNIVFHSDTVQTIGKLPVNVNDLGMDLLAISAHKIYGPKGIGAIYIRKGTDLVPLIHGGAQERKNRPGTENIPLIAGFAKAVELAGSTMDKTASDVAVFKNELIKMITASCSGIIFNSDSERSIPHILSISLDPEFYDVESETMLMGLDLRGVAVSSGSACTSGSVQPSHVLMAMGYDKRTAQSAVRFSFGKFTTIQEVVSAGNTFCSMVQSFKKQ
ncbi:MAG: cysteine desulfurase family protein [Bacteroidota bacterium]